MGSMTRPASDSLSDILARLDARVRRVDEERWLSSRYAPTPKRQSLIVLYAFYYELARVRVAVSDPTLGQIRFQWWRDALTELARGDAREHDTVLALASELAADHFDIVSLQAMVDRFETAFLANDRHQEPEDLLAIAAARLCEPDEDVEAFVSRVAQDWARLRRSETVLDLAPREPIVTVLRPALGHYRMRHVWSRGARPGRLQTRLCILMAVLTGKI